MWIRWAILLLVGVMTVALTTSEAVGMEPAADPAAPGAAQGGHDLRLPAGIADADTTTIVWIDLRTLTDEVIFESVEAIFAQIDDANFPDKNRQLDKVRQELIAYRWFQQAFTALGGRGVLIGVRIGPDMHEQVFALIHADPGSDSQMITEALTRQSNLEASGIGLAPYAPGWFALVDRRAPTPDRDLPPLTMPPSNGPAKYAQMFDAALRYSGDAPVRLAFRMPGSQRVQLQMLAQAPEMAMFRGIVQPLSALNGGTASVRFGRQPQLLAGYHFGNEESAAQFAAAADSLLTIMGGVLSMQLQQSPNPPDPRQLAAALQALKLRPDGRTAHLRVDQFTIARFAALWPAMRDFVQQQQQQSQQVIGAKPASYRY